MRNTTKPDALEMLRPGDLEAGIRENRYTGAFFEPAEYFAIIAALEAERREYEAETSHLRAMLHAADKQFESIAQRDAKIRAALTKARYEPLEFARANVFKAVAELDGGRN